MGSNVTPLVTNYFHSGVPFGSPESAIWVGALRSGHDVPTLRPWSSPDDDVPRFEIAREVALSSPCSSFQLRNPLPPINEISPPPMKHRDPQANLMPPVGHLRSNQPNGSPNPFDVFLPIKWRQDQVPNPERQIVGQLGTKQIDPVAHKSFHGKMKEKLIRKLGNPSLAHPSLVM